MEIEVEGLVIRTYGRESFTCVLHNGESAMEFASRDFIQPGESVHAVCERAEHGRTAWVARKVERVPDIYPKVEALLRASVKLKESALLGGRAEPMKDDIGTVARKIMAASALGRFILVRFHGDADGISSALTLKKFLKAGYAQQNSAIYSVGDAIRDLERMGQQFKPLIILLDFGSGDDSAEGLGLARAGGIELVAIDHHPPGSAQNGLFSAWANPWKSGIEDGSDYPAGYLCAALAHMLGSESAGLERTACAGDKSPVLELSKEDRESALVLDFAATYSGGGSGTELFSELLSNRQLFDSVLHQAKTKMEELDRTLSKAVKTRTAGGVQICTVNLDGVAEKREFPTKGKIVSRVLELHTDEGPLLVLGFARKGLIFRLNGAAASRGIRGDEIVRRMKSSFPDFVENGGGHARAAALKISEGFENAAVDEVVKMIGGWNDKGA
ncbi:MAG: DHH family phosphoesterase [Candidatus Micrarchaeia archaeon]